MKSFIFAFTVALATASVLMAEPAASVESSNIVGCTPVALNASGYTAVTVHYSSLADTSMTIAELISTHNLSGSDAAENAPKLTVYTQSKSCVYYLNAAKQWVAVDSANPALSTVTVASGSAFWFQQGATSVSTLYLVGQLDSAATGIAIVKGQNLLGNGLPFDVDLTKVTFTGAVKGRGTGAADIIQLVKADGATLSRYFLNKQGQWIDADTSSAVSAIQVPAGAAFWYIHKGNGITVNFGE